MARDADQVYVLLHRDVRVSRNARAQWYLDRLHKTFDVDDVSDDDDKEEEEELRPVGFQPRGPDDGPTCRVTQKTEVSFLALRYRIVYVLDTSPSVAGSSSAAATATTAAALLRRSLLGLCAPFRVPGGRRVLRPDIFVTVVAWSPFLTRDSSQQYVLCQGWCARSDNVDRLCSVVAKRLCAFQSQLARTNRTVQRELSVVRTEAQKMMGGLFEEGVSPAPPPGLSVPVVSADTGFVSMVRTGLLALQLLPKNSSASIVVITDGAVSVPDSDACDAMLAQLRTKTIALSFIQTTSSQYPHNGLSRMPYRGLLQFISSCTHGTLLDQVMLH